MKIAFLLMVTLTSLTACAQDKVIQLYNGAAPGSESWTHKEAELTKNVWNTRIVYNVANPTLTVVAPDAKKANGAAIVICPGGGFYALSIDSEGLDVARWLAAKGVTCFVLKYRLVHSLTADPISEMGPDINEKVKPIVPLALQDANTAIQYVREHAAAYKINPKHIGIVGFSAGGTVAGSAAYTYTEASRPDFVAPIYLQYDWVIHATKVPADAPPAFILAASDDGLGLAPHSVRFYTHWINAGKSAELHLYAKGGHGFGMRKQNLPSDKWIELFAAWLDTMGFMK